MPDSKIQSILKAIHATPLREFVTYWFRCRNGHQVTRRADIDPFLFAHLLPHMFLYDYDRLNRNLTLRLAGEEIRRILPNSRPGTPLEEIMPSSYYLPVLERYRRVCEEPAIMVASGRVFMKLGGTGVGERVLMPLADTNDRVHQMLGATLYLLGDHLIDGSQFTHEEVMTTFSPLSAGSESE